MNKPKMDEKVRQDLLKKLEDAMAQCGKRLSSQPSAAIGYWEGKIDGINAAFRLLDTGSLAT